MTKFQQIYSIVNGEVFCGDGFVLRDVFVEDELISSVDASANASDGASVGDSTLGSDGASVGESTLGSDGASAGDSTLGSDGASAECEILDASGCYVIPGLIDIHFHGAVGFDASDADLAGLHKIGAYEASNGILAMCPATMTLSEAQIKAAVMSAKEYVPAENESNLVGLNMEGPFISPDKLGAQNPDFVRAATIEEFRRLQNDSGGLFKIVDIAPETDGALDFISALSDEVRISLAHSNADYETARAAFDVGARHLTHMYNAMNPMHHRDPGPIPAAAERDDITPEIIADGVHVHPSMVRLAFKLFGDDRVILISDSMRATGLSDGKFDLGGQEVFVQGNHAKLENGSLAGSVSNLMQCFKVAVKEMDIPLVSATKAATINPARAIGVDGQFGSLAQNKLANIVLLDKQTLDIRNIVCRGKLIL